MKEFNAYKLIELKFPRGLFIYDYMAFHWSKVNTLEDALNYFHKWHNEMLASQTQVKIDAIKSIIYPLYSMITNRSYESKIML